MGNAVVTGTVDLATLEVTSVSSADAPHFATPIDGELRLNGVMVPLRAETVDAVVNTINRFTPQTIVTASIGTGSSELSSESSTEKSSAPGKKYLVLTSPEHMRVAGDIGIAAALGLETGGLTRTSSAEK
jgi:hypothetical protein